MAAKRLMPSSLLILGGAVALLVGSFLPFYSQGPFDINAWDTLVPITILPLVCGALMAAHIGLATWGDLRVPPALAGFTWNQIHLALGFQAAVMMVAWFVTKRSPATSLGLGFWLMFAGSVALAVGAFMRTREGAPRRF